MTLTKIGTDGVKDDAITSGKIPANAVGVSELAQNAVSSANIIDGSILQGDLSDNIINSAKIAPQAVTLAHLEHGTSSNDGKFLRANNGADPTFETVTSTAINNNGSNRIITGSSTANTLEGESTFTYDGVSKAKIDTDQTYGYLQLDGNSGGSIEFYENGNRKFEIYGIDAGIEIFDRDKSAYHSKFLSGGDFEISDGNLKFASGHGIDFSASSNESGSTTELLDDYERGNFTGQWYFSPTNASSVTYTYQGGMYVKIGRMVYFTLHMWTSSKGTLSSGSGWCQISGLPFAVDGEGGFASISYYDNFGSYNPAVARVTPSEQIYIAQHNSGGYSQDLQWSHMNNSSRLHIGGCYATTS